MTKRKKLAFAIMIISIVSMIIGFLLGKITFSKSMDSIPADPSYSDAQKDTDNDYPFALYNTFLINASGEIVDKLNNNPIDKMYYEKFVNCSTPGEEQDVLADWDKAYENELNNAKKVLEISLNKKSKDNDMSPEDVLSVIEDYVSICSAYNDTTSQLAYSFEEFNLGYGTNHIYDLLLNSLDINRMNTLHLVECIYMLGEDYIWLEQAN